MLCILYVNAAGALLGLVGLLIERLLPIGWPRRWMWCATIPASVVLPGYYRFHNAWSLTDFSAQHAVGGSHGLASLPILSPALWGRVQDYDTALNTTWIGLSGLVIILALLNAIRLSELLHLSGRRGRELVDGIPVVLTETLGPATVGVLSSRVVVPRWVLALPDAKRGYVIRHEAEHRRAFDAQILFMASLPIVLTPWNLALWWQLRRLCLAVEVDCDKRVVNELGNPNAYGELLLQVAEVSSRTPQLQPAFLGGPGSIERRLTALIAPTQLRGAQKFILPLVALSLLGLVLWMPHPVVGSCDNSHQAPSSVAAGAHNE